MTKSSKEKQTSSEPFVPSSAEEAAEAYELAAILWRELKKEVQQKPEQKTKD